MVDLTRIELENFGPYFGENNIDIGYSDKKLVIFEGDNGSGKTLLINAIQWCLFGNSNNPSTKERDIFLCNQESLLDALPGQIINSRVTLTFERDDGKPVREKITFSRKIQVKRKKQNLTKTESGAIIFSPEDFEVIEHTIRGNPQEFSAIRWIGNEQQTAISNPEIIRETYFPRIVRDYYIIYGEDFVDPRQPEKLQIAIERNCYGEIFDKISENLSKLQIELMRNQTTDSKKRKQLEEYGNEREAIYTSKKTRTKKIGDYREQLSKTEEAISKLDREIGKSDSEHAKLLNAQREELDRTTKELDKKIRELSSRISGDGAGIYASLLTKESQDQLNEELKKRVKKGEIPPDIKVKFIDELIENRKCVCGSKITPAMEKSLLTLRNENAIGEYYNELLSLKYQLQKNIDELPEKVRTYKEKLVELEEQKTTLDENKKNLANISQQLSSMKNVDKLEKQRSQFVELRTTLNNNILLETSGLETDRAEEIRLNSLISKLTGNSYDDSQGQIISFTDALLKNVEQVKKTTIDSTRQDIEKYASEVYKKIFRDSYQISRIELDDHYRVKVILNSDKEKVKTNFSTGEGLIFAISFLSALRKYSGYSGPIFLDSPFSVLDEDHRAKVSLNIPESIPGQLIICTRADTFEEDIKPKILKYTNKIIMISKESEGHTKIKQQRV